MYGTQEPSVREIYGEDEAVGIYLASLKKIKEYRKEEERRHANWGHMSTWQKSTHRQDVLDLRTALRYLVSDEDL